MVRTLALLQSTAIVLSLSFMGVSATSAVSGTIVGRCTNSVANGTLSFGAYDPITANATSPLEVTGSISLTCTKGDNVVIQLSTGSNAGAAGSVACATLACSRAMKDSGTDYLGYDIYTPNGTVCAYSTVWNTSNTVTWIPSTMAALNVPVCGYIAAGQYVPDASYTDSVTVTVNY